MTAKDELAHIVDDYLERGMRYDPYIGAMMLGLMSITRAMGRAQAKTEEWAQMLAELRDGAAHVQAALDVLRGEDGFTGLVRHGERMIRTAASIAEDIERLRPT
jgi:hypothetical protein